MRIRIGAAMTAAVVGLAMATGAVAGDRDEARVAIAAAKAKVDANEKAGLHQEATDTQGRARLALDDAMKQFKDSDEDHALMAANEAAAMADLAAATSDLKTIEAERDKLAAAR